jgi:hypothetical protein
MRAPQLQDLKGMNGPLVFIGMFTTLRLTFLP